MLDMLDYVQPVHSKTRLKCAAHALAEQLRRVLYRLLERDPLPVCEAPPRDYEAPTLSKPTTEQARLLLIGHAAVGDQGTKDLLQLVFPENLPKSESHSRRKVGGAAFV